MIPSSQNAPCDRDRTSDFDRTAKLPNTDRLEICFVRTLVTTCAPCTPVAKICMESLSQDRSPRMKPALKLAPDGNPAARYACSLSEPSCKSFDFLRCGTGVAVSAKKRCSAYITNAHADCSSFRPAYSFPSWSKSTAAWNFSSILSQWIVIS